MKVPSRRLTHFGLELLPSPNTVPVCSPETNGPDIKMHGSWAEFMCGHYVQVGLDAVSLRSTCLGVCVVFFDDKSLIADVLLPVR